MPAKYLYSAHNKTVLRGNSWLHIANLGELIFSVIFFQVLTKYILIIQYVTFYRNGTVHIFWTFNRIYFLHISNIKMTLLGYTPWISHAPIHLAECGCAGT